MRGPASSARSRLAGGGEKGGFKTAFEAEIVAEIETLVGTGTVDDWDFEAIETAARRQAMRVAARAVERLINADTSDYAGATLPCPCRQPAHYAGRHDKAFGSVLGLLTLSRAYYHCDLCKKGFCPRDHALGLQDGSLSPGVLRMVRYAEFRAAGLCTSTGVVESGCKTATGTRCKRSGMHWTVAGADAIIAPRCRTLSGRFEDFWERRAQRRVAA